MRILKLRKFYLLWNEVYAMSGRKDSEPIMTIIFVVINVLVFVVLEIMGDTQNSEFMAERTELSGHHMSVRDMSIGDF